MSLPSGPAVGLGALGAAQAIQYSPFEQVIMGLNTNPYFIGTMMLLLNLGGRFIAMEMSKGQETFFQNPWVRRLLLFTVVFVGTRNVIVAFWMSLVIILLIGYLFNENSSLCLFHLGVPGSSCQSGLGGPGSLPPQGLPPQGQGQPQVQQAGVLTPEEAEIFRRLQEKQIRATVTLPKEQGEEVQKAPPKPSDIYWQNMAWLNKAEGFRSNGRF